MPGDMSGKRTFAPQLWLDRAKRMVGVLCGVVVVAYRVLMSTDARKCATEVKQASGLLLHPSYQARLIYALGNAPQVAPGDMSGKRTFAPQLWLDRAKS